MIQSHPQTHFWEFCHLEQNVQHEILQVISDPNPTLMLEPRKGSLLMEITSQNEKKWFHLIWILLCTFCGRFNLPHMNVFSNCCLYVQFLYDDGHNTTLLWSKYIYSVILTLILIKEFLCYWMLYKKTFAMFYDISIYSAICLFLSFLI